MENGHNNNVNNVANGNENEGMNGMAAENKWSRNIISCGVSYVCEI